ncbi:hypothetical protein PENSUB_2361 [Penicillium subrubescens]|uniref:Uncharacterized protein n=1 Tax=Penicillium subrubescens TaxID=1316194 RepID=A0A1Q5UI11_9EURO|nr:hypothetical protein PENSUB_2361 [Penicillium subrubescens]
MGIVPKEHRGNSDHDRLNADCHRESNQYKLYEVHSGKIVFSRDVEFDERATMAPLIEGKQATTSRTTLLHHLSFLNQCCLHLAHRLRRLCLLTSQRKRHLTQWKFPHRPIQSRAKHRPHLGYSLYGQRRKPSRHLLESVGKVYATGALNTTPAKDFDPSTFHEAASGPNRLELWAAILK